MTSTFPDAPDFNQPWRRTTETSIADLEKRVEILTKNLRSFTRSGAAGTKAISRRISGLSGVRIPPGTPINVQVYPYAYFTTNGYPAAGARVYWGDQNDADKYEIWVRRVTAPDMADYVDFQQEGSSQIATADIRGLECLTDYELMVRAVSPFGSYGLFTGTVLFTTPAELTLIPWLGDPYAQWSGGGAAIGWDFTPTDAVPPATEYEEDLTRGSSAATGTLTGWGNHAQGVLAPNGKIYYPPGGWSGSGYEEKSRGVILDPATSVATETDYGLYPMLGWNYPGSTTREYGAIYGGILGDDGIIYWVSNWHSVHPASSGTYHYGTIIALDPDTETATFTPVQDQRLWMHMAKGGNGKIYALPSQLLINPGSGFNGFLVINPDGTHTLSTLGFDPGFPAWNSPDQYWGQGATDANGDVWFMPWRFTNYFIKIDISTNTASRVPVQYPGDFEADWRGLAGPVVTPDGSIYAFSWQRLTSGVLWYRIAPDGTHSYGTGTGVSMGNAALSHDGRIRGLGTPMLPDITAYATMDGASVNAVGVFDPATEQFSTSIIGSGSEWHGDSAVPDADGAVWFRTTKPRASGSISSDRFIRVTSSRIDFPAIPGVGEIPNYFKHMLVERQSATGWDQVGAMTWPGVCMDMRATPGNEYTYRLVPISTAGTRGTPSATVRLSGAV